MSLPLFRKEAIEAKKGKLYGDVILVQPMAYSILAIFLAVIVAVGVLYISIATYAKKEIVYGFVAPNKGVSKVYVPQTGVVQQIFVTEGDLVKAGDPLFTIMMERALNGGGSAELAILSSIQDQIDLIEQQIESQALEEELNLERLHRQKNSYELQLEQLQERLTFQHEVIEAAEKNLEGLEGLLEKGFATQVEYQNRKEALFNNKSQEAALRQQIEEIQNQLDQVVIQIETSPIERQNRLADLQTRRNELLQRQAEMQGQRAITITAPIDGQVTALQMASGVLAVTNIPQISILPEDSVFEAELFVPVRAIGFVRPDQEVKISYDAFRFQNFGTYEAKIMNVSKAVLTPSELPVPLALEEPVYRVKASLEDQHVRAFGERFPLQAGMTIEARIILERRSLLDVLLEPLYALRENM